MKTPKIKYPQHYEVSRALRIGGVNFADQVRRERAAFREGWLRCYKENGVPVAILKEAAKEMCSSCKYRGDPAFFVHQMESNSKPSWYHRSANDAWPCNASWCWDRIMGMES